MADSDFEPFSLQQEMEKDALRASLKEAYTKLAKAKNRNALLVEATEEGAREALLAVGRTKPIPAPKLTKREGHPEYALMHMTDWQGAKLTTTYNTQVMKDRVRRYIQQCIKIVRIQRKDHPVNEAIVVFGGDMIEGLFQFPSQPFEIDATIFDQFVTVAQLIAEALLGLAGEFLLVKVIAEWGNHGRIGSKRAVVPKSDNFDRMCYRLAQEMCVNQPRITWQDNEEDIQRLELGNYRALVIHGDEIGRNGFASPTTIVQKANNWRSGAYKVNDEPWWFNDVYMGHFHTHAEWPLANGEGAVYQTGSTESDNRYARDSMAASAVPSQRLHFIHPIKGKVTAQYKIHLAEDW